MALPAQTNAVPTGFEEHYADNGDGTYTLDVSDLPQGWEFGDVTPLRNTLGKQKTELKQLKDRVSKFGDYDPDDVVKAMDEVGTLRERVNNSPDAETIRRQLAEEIGKAHQTELSKRDESFKKQQNQLHKLLIENQARQALEEMGGSPELLLPIINGRVKMEVGDDGQAKAVVYNDEGHPAYGQNGEKTIAELVSELKSNQAFAPAFKGVGIVGSGSNKSNQQTPLTQDGVMRIPANDNALIQKYQQAIQEGKAEIVDVN